MNKLEWESEEEREMVVNQFEALRRNGTNNMMDFGAVEREAFDSNFYNFVNFFGNDRNKYTSFLFAFDQYSYLIDQDLVDELMDKLN